MYSNVIDTVSFQRQTTQPELRASPPQKAPRSALRGAHASPGSDWETCYRDNQSLYPPVAPGAETQTDSQKSPASGRPGPRGTPAATVPGTGLWARVPLPLAQLVHVASPLNRGVGHVHRQLRSSLESTGRPKGHPSKALSNCPSALTLGHYSMKQGEQLPVKIFTSEACFVPYLAAECIPKNWTTEVVGDSIPELSVARHSGSDACSGQPQEPRVPDPAHRCEADSPAEPGGGRHQDQRPHCSPSGLDLLGWHLA
ncbi:hypothetical protein D623_10016832 [Myotis brandtii]|uniref:Uncharacterized protein n=1 Tax=Myotis brandtii TaxID=109478 RepID=S7QAT5_MYOBR|nr:hypothetical protein D623_10016832 [Myotis brandtii]